MPDSVQELTGTLLSAIDQEGNVKDMTVVLRVVKVLENTDVTAEDLKVTRLGKFINLIRRKLAEIDKPLSKRLKNLVKQWQQLVPSRAPNGIIPSSSSSASQPPPPAARNPPSTLPSNVSNNSHASLSIRTTTPSPMGVNSTVGRALSQQIKTTSPPKHNASFLAPSDISTTTNSRPSSRGPPSRSCTPTPTPTPSMSTHASRPTQPVHETPASHRSKMMQKLSSFKRRSHAVQKEGVTSRPEMASETPLPLPPHQTGSDNEERGDGMGVASTSGCNVDEELSRALWSSDPFTDMAMDDLTVGEIPWSQTVINGNQSADATPMYNGARLHPPVPDFTENSRKRPRPYSPLESAQSTLSTPAHKKHKQHKSSSSRAKMEAGTLKCVVHIPLEGIILNHHHLPVHVLPVEENGVVVAGDKLIKGASPVVDLDDGELVVSIRRSLLSRIPAVANISLKCSTPSTHKSKGRRRSLDRGHHQSQYLSSGAEQSSSIPDLPILPDIPDIHDVSLLQHQADRPPHTKPVASTSSVTTESSGDHLIPSCSIPVSRQRPTPQGVCPGVDGCVSSDGYWYEWTEHISSNGESVTVLPYVYFEDNDYYSRLDL